MTVGELRKETKENISTFMPGEAAVVTDLVLCNMIGIEREDLYLCLDQQLPTEAEVIMAEVIKRLSRGVPIQYIVGSCYFFGVEIKVGPGVFIPRSDTEVLAQAAIKALPKNGSFIDLCAGSGCISAAIASQRSDCKGIALELSMKAMNYTVENLTPFDNVDVKRFDALDEDDYDSLAAEHPEKFDLLVCNPPYIPTEDIDTLSTQVHYEPETALDGGEDGMKYYKIIPKLAPRLLKEHHYIMFEVGIGQAGYVEALMKLYGYTTAILKDLGGIDRVVIAAK